MADAGDGRKKKRRRKKESPGKWKGKPGKMARKRKPAKRYKLKRGRWLVKMLYAMAHPVRRSIMGVYVEEGEPRSPTQIAKLLALRTNTVAYHVTVLKRLGALEIVAEQQTGIDGEDIEEIGK